ncbi:Potassium channel [Entomophthora muscae]|uniref:Potassium channel n=1 Tax=Entomophthora muscae TaxID=34485 RepID=A0ACC2UHW6_9FUNG|nr:Potassium channel [Entomophthora muscae]
MSHSKTPSTSSVKYDELRYLPMLVGAISPISIIMSLPPLTGSWITFDGKERKNNKGLELTVLVSVAVLFALVANLCLLFRFMERRIVLNTFLSVVGYTLHAAFMFVPIGYFYFTENKHPQEKFTGDFWAGASVSGISLVLACLLVIDYFQNNRLRLRGSGVSSKQRTLVLFCIFVTMWSTFGAMVFSFVEKWSFTRGVYFTLVTMTTIGFGDFKPEHLGTRIFLFPYAIIGIVAMGILINSIRIVIVERFESIYLKKVGRIGNL